VTSIGEGGTSQGDFYEAMNVAGAWQLPVVFVVNNNQWAISVPRSAQTHSQTIAQKAVAAGIYSEQVDGNDIIAVTQALQEAIDGARNGEGASVIECLTYRLCDHTTADDATRYRDADEVAQAWTQEPIKRLREYLIQQHHWTTEQEETLLSECKDTVTAAVAEYEAMGMPAITDMFDYHFADMPMRLQLQRQEALEEAQHA
jgi:pyruvate dehydrogenase E1 component alpha subunit